MLSSPASDTAEHIKEAIELWPDIEDVVQGLRGRLEPEESEEGETA